MVRACSGQVFMHEQQKMQRLCSISIREFREIAPVGQAAIHNSHWVHWLACKRGVNGNLAIPSLYGRLPGTSGQ